MSSAYSNPAQRFSCGTVRGYNPSQKLYTINVDGFGEQRARSMRSGADKPMPVGTRAIAILIMGAEWLILGELDQAPDPAILIADSAEETLAKARGELEGTVTSVSFRPRDVTGVPEDLVFTGDVRIEARGEKRISRPYVHLYRFGDIVVHASSLCFMHLSRLKNTFFLRARDLREKFVGASREVLTDDDSRTTTDTRLNWADPLGDPIIKETLGAVSADEQVISTGVRRTVGSIVVEEDADTGTLRFQIGETVLIMGSMVAENGEHPVSGVTNEATPAGAGIDNGLIIKRGDSILRLDEDRIEIDRGGASVVLDTGIKLTVGNQSCELTGLGITFSSPGQEVSMQSTGITLSSVGQQVDITPTGIILDGVGQRVEMSDLGVKLTADAIDLAAGEDKVTISGVPVVTAGSKYLQHTPGFSTHVPIPFPPPTL